MMKVEMKLPGAAKTEVKMKLSGAVMMKVEMKLSGAAKKTEVEMKCNNYYLTI